MFALGIFSQRAHSQIPLGVTVTWKTNSEPDIAGYHVYFGPQTNAFTNRVTVGPTQDRVRLEPLVPGADYYMVLTAFNTAGTESLPTDPPLHYQAPLTATNTPPTFVSPIPDQYIFEDPEAPPRIDFFVTDIESAPSALTVRAQSSNPQLIPDTYILIGGSGSRRTLMIVPQLDQWGTANITLELRDPHGASSSLTFAVVVEPQNDIPVLSPIADQRIDEDAGVKLPFYIFDTETPPGGLWLLVMSSDQDLIPDESIVVNGVGNSRALVFTPQKDTYGSCIIDVFAVDSEGAYGWTWFTVAVSRVNDPPTLDAIPSFSIDAGAGPVVVGLSGISSGARNEAQSVTISAVSSDPQIVATPHVDYVGTNDVGSLIIAPVPGMTGTAIITVTVSDGDEENGVTSRSFSVNVRPFNNPPLILSLPDLAVLRLPTPLQINFNVMDPDTPADELIVTGYSHNPELLPSNNMVFSGTGTQRTLTIEPLPGHTGLATVTVVVSDGESTVSSSFYVLIAAATQ